MADVMLLVQCVYCHGNCIGTLIAYNSAQNTKKKKTVPYNLVNHHPKFNPNCSGRK